MATEIKQVRDEARHRTILRVSGEMFRSDAELLERIASDITASSGDAITLDLADLSLLDSEAAHILRRLSSGNGLDIEGLDVLVQGAIDDAERASQRD